MSYRNRLIDFLTEKVAESDVMSLELSRISEAIVNADDHQTINSVLTKRIALSRRYSILNQEILFLSMILREENQRSENVEDVAECQ